MIKNFFVLRVNNYWPELCQYTVPTLKSWAENHGYNYIEISERQWEGFPPVTEKLQVHKLGAGADWNLLIDADVMLRPDFPDPSKIGGPGGVVRASYSYAALGKFPLDIYYARDGRGIGFSTGCILTDSLTHDLWEVPENLAELLPNCLNPNIFDEYVMTRNLAKYGLHFDGIADDPDRYVVHFGGTNSGLSQNQKEQKVLQARELSLDWKMLWPHLEQK